MEDGRAIPLLAYLRGTFLPRPVFIVRAICLYGESKRRVASGSNGGVKSRGSGQLVVDMCDSIDCQDRFAYIELPRARADQQCDGSIWTACVHGVYYIQHG